MASRSWLGKRNIFYCLSSSNRRIIGWMTMRGRKILPSFIATNLIKGTPRFRGRVRFLHLCQLLTATYLPHILSTKSQSSRSSIAKEKWLTFYAVRTLGGFARGVTLWLASRRDVFPWLREWPWREAEEKGRAGPHLFFILRSIFLWCFTVIVLFQKCCSTRFSVWRPSAE